jgi:DNA repair protein RecO (recombination protein O)
MSAKYRTKGLIFKKDNRHESDSVFTIFTSDFGKMDIFAKAIRKIVSKLRAGVGTFYLSEIEFIDGKNRKTLTDAAIIKKFKNITGNPEKLDTAVKIAEVLDSFIKGQEKDEAIFNLLVETFDNLNSQNCGFKNQKLIYYYFLWNFLSLLGYQPEVQNCTACCEKLNPYNIYFSNKDGGIICKKCLGFDSSAKKINSDAAKILRLIQKKDWQIISKLKVEQHSQNLLEEISDGYCRYILPVSLSNAVKL